MSFREVTRQEFFAYVGPRDVHPRPMPDHSLWLDQKTHGVVGKSTPGYRDNVGESPRYFLTEKE